MLLASTLRAVSLLLSKYTNTETLVMTKLQIEVLRLRHLTDCFDFIRICFQFKPSAKKTCQHEKKKQTNKQTVDLSSNLCGITGVVWNP